MNEEQKNEILDWIDLVKDRTTTFVSNAMENLAIYEETINDLRPEFYDREFTFQNRLPTLEVDGLLQEIEDKLQMLIDNMRGEHKDIADKIDV